METNNLMKDYNIALLIDAENISYKYIDKLIEEIKAYGSLTVRRVYGDFTSQNLSPWKNICNERAIKPIQGNIVASGKNNSDSALIIDAMDILHQGKVNAFCLATSDSDFTSLAMRIREDGLFVIGAGEDKTTKAFIETCDRFIRLGNEEKKIVKTRRTRHSSGSKKVNPELNETVEDKTLLRFDKEIRDKVEEIKSRSRFIIDNKGDGEYIKLSQFMNELYRYYSDFNVRDYGYKSNKEFFKDLGFVISLDEKSAVIIKY